MKNPVSYNEKMQWLKLNDRKPEYSRMVDKYEVRSFIAETIGDEYLIPCYGVYDSFDEIDFAYLPEQFVLKCTHDSGSVVICKDKKNFDIEEARVDWYLLEDKIYFGEITFFNSSGLVPYCDKKDDLFMGSLLDLNLRKC